MTDQVILSLSFRLYRKITLHNIKYYKQFGPISSIGPWFSVNIVEGYANSRTGSCMMFANDQTYVNVKDLAREFDLDIAVKSLYGPKDIEDFYSLLGIKASQVALRLASVVGGSIDVYELFTGKDIFTQRELSQIEKALSAVGLG